jgi:WD40 repeat protein
MIRSVHHCAATARWVIAHQARAAKDNESPLPDRFSIWQWPFRAGHCEWSAFRISFVQSSSLSPDGRLIALVHGAPESVLSIFDLSDGVCLASVGVQSGGTGAALAWSPDGAQLASVQDGAVRLYSVPALRLSHEILVDYPSDLAFSPDGSLLTLGAWAVGWLITRESLANKPQTSLRQTPRKRGLAG